MHRHMTRSVVCSSGKIEMHGQMFELVASTGRKAWSGSCLFALEIHVLDGQFPVPGL